MTDRDDRTDLQLPDDLRALDEELSAIRYEERPSFGPELRAELARVWGTRPRVHPVAFRHLAAAALGGLLLIGASAPSARASLVRLFGALSSDEPAPAPVTREAVAPPVVEVTPEPAPPEELPAAPAAVGEPVPTPAPTVASSVPPILPRMLDRDRARDLLERAYPMYLQRQGVGGVVWVRAWVDATGRTDMASVARGSGVQDLDRAALDVTPYLRFEPALQGGVAVATWIEFPVVFEPEASEVTPVVPPPIEDPLRLPVVHPDDQWEYDQPLSLSTLPAWEDAPEATLSDVEAALVDAIGDPIVRRSLGPVESILSGIAPAGRAPDEWRAAASTVLEDAIARAPENPAPQLALGRLRLRQGLRTEARMLFEQGLQIAIQAESSVEPAVVAELHYERGMLIRDGWLASHAAGRVRAGAFDMAQCAQARSSGGAASGYASVERLIAWNYLCPAELTRVFDEGFEPREDGLTELSLMMGSFRAAIAAEPGHVASNVGLLTTLADQKRWEDVLAGARRFARQAHGHPYALLFAGLALMELDRAREADAHFREALERLPPAEADRIRDVEFVIDADQVAGYRRLWGDERRAWEDAFWRTRDRTPSTAVNEREVEHLARSTYALFRFGGSTSDPGEVWVRFGGPNRVHVVDEGAGKLTEFWDYGSGPDITFVRWVASQSMDLTPEGRAYVDDLGKIFPPQ